jgi:general stress protein 26
MEKLNFKEEIQNLFKQIKDHKIMVLATCVNNYPTARSISAMKFNGNIYFQTGIDLIKYKQIVVNNNVALSFDNVQIEGIANIIGKPLDKKNSEIIGKFKKYYKSAFNTYSHLADEILIEIIIKKVTLWKYDIKLKPYRIFIDVEKEDANKEYIKI